MLFFWSLPPTGVDTASSLTLRLPIRIGNCFTPDSLADTTWAGIHCDVNVKTIFCSVSKNVLFVSMAVVQREAESFILKKINTKHILYMNTSGYSWPPVSL